MGPLTFPDPSEAGLIGAVAHALRLRILRELERAPATLAQLSERLEVPRSIMAQHVGELMSHRLVERADHLGHEEYQLVEPRVAQVRHALLKLAHDLPHSAGPRRALPAGDARTHDRAHARAY